MPWWGWIIVGALLLGAEMTFVDLELYLVFLGISALAVGLFDLAGAPLPEWGEWLTFALIAVVSMVTMRRWLYEKTRTGATNLDEHVIGERFTLPQSLGPGESCRAELRGTQWTVENGGSEPLAAGSRVRVLSSSGLTLTVAPAADGS